MWPPLVLSIAPCHADEPTHRAVSAASSRRTGAPRRPQASTRVADSFTRPGECAG